MEAPGMLLQELRPSAALGGISSPCCICEQVPPNLRDALTWKGGQNLDNHHSPAWEPAQPQARPQICPTGLRDLSQLICPTDLHPIASAPPGHPHFPLPGGAEASHPFGMCCSLPCSCSHSPLFWGPRALDTPVGLVQLRTVPTPAPPSMGMDSPSPPGYREQIHVEAALGLDATAGQLSQNARNTFHF